ncbi:hypothetical protein [Thalassoglobus polymorphus]|uniref:Uncharacterized protein n=1 Tax=Thalassoglobus polymorphus TaxID=2527994 RepID=A0A517QPS7_9PLAN|nr:hypothetical protein [Thalassoglobus polymorphus]QDT33648.1 hypothetical protein Mal48_29020 [Thalassoglobus polymorphus]
MSENQIDFELQIQRCIDGELDEQSQVNFLRSLDEHADDDAWRKLSLGFVENQILASYFATEESEPVDVVDSHVSSAQAPEPGKRYNFRPFLSLAAAVTIGAFLGFEAKHFGSIPNTDSIVQQRSEPSLRELNSPVIEISPERSESATRDSGLRRVDQLAQNNPNQVAPKQIGPNQNRPVAQAAASSNYRFSDIDGSSSDWTHQQKFLQELRQKGYTIERSQSSRSVPVGNGQEVVVPAETILIRHSVH